MDSSGFTEWSFENDLAGAALSLPGIVPCAAVSCVRRSIPAICHYTGRTAQCNGRRQPNYPDHTGIPGHYVSQQRFLS